MRKNNLDCPNCKGNVVKSYGGETKLRAKLLKWNKDGMFAVCKSCGTDIAISTELLKSIQSGFVYEIEEESTCFN